MRAYRVLTFLLEKPEVGPAILDDILVDIFRYFNCFLRIAVQNIKRFASSGLFIMRTHPHHPKCQGK